MSYDVPFPLKYFGLVTLSPPFQLLPSNIDRIRATLKPCLTSLAGSAGGAWIWYGHGKGPASRLFGRPFLSPFEGSSDVIGARREMGGRKVELLISRRYPKTMPVDSRPFSMSRTDGPSFAQQA